MKIFDQTARDFWGSKVNFADENNVLLGYDTDQCCCENAGWFISDTPQAKVIEGEQPNDLPGFVFDTSYFQEVSGEDEFDAGGMAIFRIHDGGKEKFIHIYNCHNGYYGHGFEFTRDAEKLREGGL
jgi:hypothetical protein